MFFIVIGPLGGLWRHCGNCQKFVKILSIELFEPTKIRPAELRSTELRSADIRSAELRFAEIIFVDFFFLII